MSGHTGTHFPATFPSLVLEIIFPLLLPSTAIKVKGAERRSPKWLTGKAELYREHKEPLPDPKTSPARSEQLPLPNLSLLQED